VPREIYKQAGELGYPGLNVPEEFGGPGCGQVEVAILFEELARVSPGFALSIELALVSNNIIRSSERLTEKYLEGVMNGDILLAGAATDPKGQPNGAEWDPFIKKVEGGYIANGTRLYSTNSDCDLCYVVGSDEEGNVKAIFIEKGWEGFEQHPFDKKLGQAGNGGGTQTFKDVFVPEENVAEMAVGTSETYYTVYDGCAAEALGCIRGLYEKTMEFVENRTNAGRKLTDMTAVAYNIAEIRSKIYMCESMVYDVAQHQDAAQATGDAALTQKWYEMAESVKMRVGEMLMDCAKDLLKLNGGLGYHEPMVWRFVGDQLNYCMMDLTTEIHLGSMAMLMGYLKG